MNAAAIFGSLIAGAIFGSVPGIIGYKKGKQGLAIAGFISCVVGSFLLGMFLSIPACIIFTALIVLSSKNNTSSVYQTPYAPIGKTCSQCGSLIDSSSDFCGKCGAKQFNDSAKQSNNGKFCSSCGAKIEDGAVFCYNCGAKAE